MVYRLLPLLVLSQATRSRSMSHNPEDKSTEPWAELARMPIPRYFHLNEDHQTTYPSFKSPGLFPVEKHIMRICGSEIFFFFFYLIFIGL